MGRRQSNGGDRKASTSSSYPDHDERVAWHHKITLHNGSRYNKEELLRTICDVSTVSFAPICYTKLGKHASFWVETREMASAIEDLNQSLRLSDGSKLSLQVTTTVPPRQSLTEDVLDKFKTVMGSPERYKAADNLLDLSKFQGDKAFWGQPVYAALSRSRLFREVVRLIGDNVPTVEALELSDNRFMTLDGFQELSERAPNVKSLFLANNNIRKVAELYKCKKWKLLNLKLSGNPLTKLFADTASYRAAVRKVFPSLQILDDKELPRLITFDDDPVSLPTPVAKMSAASSPAQEQVVSQFLQEYLRIHDSDYRQALMDAYHEEAVMSLSAAHVTGNKWLGAYLPYSRNLLRVGGGPDDPRRHKLLRRGPLAIVAFLDQLPKTDHDVASFTLDVTLSTDHVMSFTLTGLFRERGADPAAGVKPVTRHFARTFVIMKASDGGWNVVNETLFVTNPTQQRWRQEQK